MSRIFALAGVTTVLATGAIALGLAYESLSTPSSDATAVADIFASGFELGMAVPIVLMAGLLIAAVAVMNQ